MSKDLSGDMNAGTVVNGAGPVQSAARQPALPDEVVPHNDEAEADDDDDELGARPTSLSEYVRAFSSCLISTAVHIAGLVTLALVALDTPIEAEITAIIASPLVERPEDEPVEIELSKQIETVETQNVALMSSAPAIGAVGGGATATVGTPTLDQQVMREAEVVTNIAVDFPTVGIPNAAKLIEAVPDGDVKGEVRAIVGDYQEALDRITQEIMWMLDKGPVLVVWVFDESESMKDDQQEIRDRVENVYRQLGIYGRTSSEALLTAVTSYGEGYHVHTPRPTGNGDEIRKAINAVPVDPSGKEMMCQAVGQSIRDFRKFAQRGRQMAVILVTDESGERENNDKFLEASISEAKSANCKLYVLGRESVFGYPYAWISWKHPQTHRTHWLQIDRGPETGFPDQLQTNGYHRRHDAFSSGFGPYEQCRLARETNGVFFMLPSVEAKLVGAQKHRYDMEALRPFRPDLRSRVEVFADRDKYPLRNLIWKVISDLNPWNPQAAKVVELQVEFALNPQDLVQQIRNNQQKAMVLLKYLAEAQKAMEEGKKLREQEADPRWQANYDLIYAQIIAYQARIYEYGAGLEPYLKKLPYAPNTKSPNLVLVNWDVGSRKETLTQESVPYIEQATGLLQDVLKTYPGSPWAARAQWELQRGYGVHLVPDYDVPYVNDPNAKPPPKL